MITTNFPNQINSFKRQLKWLKTETNNVNKQILLLCILGYAFLYPQYIPCTKKKQKKEEGTKKECKNKRSEFEINY